MEDTTTFRPYRRFYEPGTLNGAQLDAFLANGWYRMRQILFTQSHYHGHPSELDRPVWWLRFPVDGIVDRDSHKRMRRRNRHLRVETLDPFVNRRVYETLYDRYFESIDFDGYPSVEEALFEYPRREGLFHTCGIGLYDGKRLVAMGVFDLGRDSCASILHFYDPDYARLSLGRHLMLLTTDLLRERGYRWYYPGYVVPGLPKFDYKLFLGREAAEYYHPETGAWKSFEDRILDPVRNAPNTGLEHSIRYYDDGFPPPFL